MAKGGRVIDELRDEARAIRAEGGEQFHADMMMRAAKRIEELEKDAIKSRNRLGWCSAVLAHLVTTVTVSEQEWNAAIDAAIKETK